MKNIGTSRRKNARRGIVLTLDITIAMLILLVSIATAYATYGAPSRAGFDIQLMRNYLQDSATIMSDLGYFSDAANTANGSGDTSGIREVMRATPSSLCMQVTGYGTVLGQDLAGYWKLDEGSGSVVSDSSGNGNSGTISPAGATFSSIGKNGYALAFNGSGYVSLSPINPPHYVSVTGWFKRNGPPIGTHHVIFMQGTQIEISIPDSTGKIRAGVTTDTMGEQVFDSGSGLNDGNWHFVAMTYDGSNLKAYIDGQQTSNQSVSGALTTGGSTNIGVYDSTYYTNGSIDEVRIYDRALTESEIQLLYSDPSNILFVVNKPECAFSGGEMQTLTVPFVLNSDQEENEYYYATMRAWIAGANK